MGGLCVRYGQWVSAEGAVVLIFGGFSVASLRLRGAASTLRFAQCRPPPPSLRQFRNSDARNFFVIKFLCRKEVAAGEKFIYFFLISAIISLMAQTEYVDIIPELEEIFFTGIQPGDRFGYSRLSRKVTLFSRKKKAGLTARSLLPQIAALWAGFSGAEKTAWATAAAEEKSVWSSTSFSEHLAIFGTGEFGVAYFGTDIPISNLSGWRLFVQDQSARLKNDIAGVATPSLLHQCWVGGLRIEAPATELKIVQLHPHFYWISQKVKGKKGMYEPVQIGEDLALPVTISLNYHSDLVTDGAAPSAKFYARFWHSYQGADLYEDLEISLDLVADWKAATATLTTLSGYVIRYDLYIHLHDLTGDLFIDNVSVLHSGQNWARDPFCSDINQGFTRAFYQIPKHWAGVIVPAGASYESVYQDF